MIMTYTRTSTIPLGTTTQLSSISGDDSAMIVAPTIQIRWQSKDQVVMNWLKSQSLSSMAAPSNSTTTPKAAPKHHGPSGGKIAGIVIGALIGLGIMIGALVFFLMMQRRKSSGAEQGETIEHAGKADKEITGKLDLICFLLSNVFPEKSSSFQNMSRIFHLPTRGPSGYRSSRLERRLLTPHYRVNNSIFYERRCPSLALSRIYRCSNTTIGARL
jgi:hypothetical protein